MKKKTEEHRKEKTRKIEISGQEDSPEEAASPAQHRECEDLAARIKEKEKEATDNYEKYLRAVADLENYKKYAAKDRTDLLKYGNEKIIKDMLPVLDGLDRALHHSIDSRDVDAFIKGIRIIHEQLMACLEKYGVKPVASVGEPFNPEKHEALMLTESNEHEEGTVLQEFEKGYMLNDRLLRAAKVSVSKKKTAGEGETEQETSQSEGG